MPGRNIGFLILIIALCLNSLVQASIFLTGGRPIQPNHAPSDLYLTDRLGSHCRQGSKLL